MANDIIEHEESQDDLLSGLLPRFLREKIKSIPDDFFNADVAELEAAITKTFPTFGNYRKLRLFFWDEYDRAVRYRLPQLDLKNVIDGICTTTKLDYFTNDPAFLSYLLRPPTSYEGRLRELLSLGLERQLETLQLPITFADGTPNTKLIDAQTRILQHIDQRLKGAIVQRTENKNINVDVPANSPTGQHTINQTTGLTLDEIEQKIQQARQRSAQLLSPSNVKVDLMKETHPSTRDTIEVNAKTEEEDSDHSSVSLPPNI